MYFPGDPLFALDPIYQSVVDPAARERLVATYDHDLTEPEWSTGYRWDIVLTGPHRTADGGERPVTLAPTPGQTVGPFFGYALPFPRRQRAGAARHAGRGAAARHGCTTAPATRCRTRSSSSGRPTRTARSCRRPARCAATARHLHRLGSRVDRPRGPLRVHDADAGRAVLRGHRLRARAAQPAVHPRLPARTRRTTPFLAALDADRRSTLITTRDETGFVFDVHLQGERETVFLTYPRH